MLVNDNPVTVRNNQEAVRHFRTSKDPVICEYDRDNRKVANSLAEAVMFFEDMELKPRILTENM